MLHAYICKRDEKFLKTSKDRMSDTPSIEGFGWAKGYTEAATEFRRLIKLLDDVVATGVGVIITAHSCVKAFDNLEGENYNRYELKVHKTIAGMAREWCDAVLFATFVTLTNHAKGEAKAKAVGGKIRVVHTEHDAKWDAKNRYELPPTMVFDMPTILEAIKGSQPVRAEDITAEIAELAQVLAEDVRGRILEAIGKHKDDVSYLSHTLNKVRVMAQTAQDSANQGEGE
jgi:hypothetical protein